MKTLLIRSSGSWQRGYVSVIAVLILALAVLAILTQSVRMSGSKALESQQYYDSVAALAAAESGTELAKTQIIANYGSNGGNLGGSCSLTTPALNSVGRGTFTYVSAQLSSAGTYCKFRVKGTVNNANRIIETWMGFTDQIGTAGYGTNPKLTLTNNYPVAALAVFDLSWRVFGSDGQNPSSGNVHCTDCGSNQLWFDELTGSANALGGIGNYSQINGTVTYSHTLGTSASDSRNFIMVGLKMGGTSAVAAPSTVGWLKFSNTSNQPSQTSQSATGSGGSGCTDDNANAVVLGISGRGAGIDPNTGIANVTAGFDSANLNNIINTSMWTKYVHYPNIDGTSPNAVGDIFAEIFYYYKGPPVLVTGANGNKNSTTINLSSAPVGLNQGDTIKSGTDIPDNTTITAINGSTLTISNKLTNKITNATLCSGICSMIPQNSGSATLTLSRNSATLAKGWVAGIACIKGVDNRYVSVVKTSIPRVIQWHEVISGE